ncbi:hypothetical protein J3E71DRAFT_353382 [Bipolaris maydis]|nr:hypothetical protein J3E71DRAFT_353382 [Bipolaris maydis]
MSSTNSTPSSSIPATPAAHSRRASHDSAHDAHHFVTLQQQRENEEKTQHKINLGIKKMWEGVKRHASEHHRSVNAAYMASYGQPSTSDNPNNFSTKNFIPDPDLRVRVINIKSNRVLYSNPRDKYIKLGKGKYESLYTIVSAYTNLAIYLLHIDSIRGHGVAGAIPAIDNESQYFDLLGQNGKLLRADQFRLYNPGTNGVVFSRTSEKPEFGTVSNKLRTFDNQCFTFEPEDMEMINIKYELENCVMGSTPPTSVFSQDTVNTTSVVQNPSLQFTVTTTQQSTFETESGIELGTLTKFSAGVPGIVETSVEMSTKLHENLSWGTMNSHSKTIQTNLVVAVPPHTAIRATATMTEFTSSLPFTARWKSVDTEKTIVTRGIYKGVNSSNLRTNYYPIQKPKAP